MASVVRHISGKAWFLLREKFSNYLVCGGDVGKEKCDIAIFILAKNEEKNIGRCLESLEHSGWDAIVLDSGSTDATRKIVSEFAFAEFRPYRYVDHCTAYNEITTNLGRAYQYVLVLDADMVVSGALQNEIVGLINEAQAPSVIESDVLMCVDGLPLEHGSLYPPKPIVFATGSAYFISSGHGERLHPAHVANRTREKLRHDDRKPYSIYLQSQLRYSQALVKQKVQWQFDFQGSIEDHDAISDISCSICFLCPQKRFYEREGRWALCDRSTYCGGDHVSAVIIGEVRRNVDSDGYRMTLIQSKAGLLKILVVVFSIGLLWGMAGFFMDGEDEATQTVDLILCNF